MANNNDGRLEFKATLDDADVVNKISKLGKEFKTISQEAEKSGKSFDEVAKAQVQNNIALGQAAKFTKEQQRAFDSYVNTVKGAQQSLKTATDPTYIALYKKQIEDSNTAMQKLVQTASKMPSVTPTPALKNIPVYDVTGNNINQMEDALRAFRDQLGSETDINRIRQINKNIETLETTITKFSNAGKKGFDEFGNKIVKVEKEVSFFTKTFGSLGSLVKSVMASFGVLAGLQLFVSLIRGGVQSIMDFDKSMTNLSAIAGVTRSSLSGLEGDIRKVAAESLNSATAVADMATELIKLGTTPEGVKALLKPVNDLSIASQMSADATAVLLKGTLNAFQASEKEATRYADVMANALNKTALDAQKFADSFTYIASTANVAGYSIEETSAMIGVLVDNNVQASSAGRVLSSVFGRLAKGGKELESELEKIRNSQDKLAQASKIFGAEGARLGVILSNNKDRLAELTKEFENSSGSLAELTNKQLQSIDSKLKIVASAWQEFVFSIENGNGVLSTFVKDFLDGLTMIINGLAKLNETSEEFNARMASSYIERSTSRIENIVAKTGQDAKKVADEQVKQLDIVIKAQEEKLEELNKSFTTGFARQMSGWVGRLTGFKMFTSKEREEYDKTKATLEALNKERDAVQFIKEVGLPEVTKTEDEDVNKTNTLIDLTKERLNLLKQINNVERELNDDVLSGRELALLKVERKYEDLITKAKELGMTDAKLRELQAKETAIVSYKADTDALKTSLDQQKVLYDEFEQYKLKVGVEGANEMYKNLLDTSKSYYDLIGEELDKVDTTDMTAKERDRYAILSKMLIEYSDNQNRIERERMQSLVDETLSYEQQITRIREEYAKKRADLSSQYEGKELEDRLKILDKTYSKEVSSLFDEFLQEGGYASKISNAVTSATKESILAQIQSLRGFLNTAENLTEAQVKSIMLTIGELEGKLATATSGSGAGNNRLSLLNNQIKQLEDARNSLMKAIEDAKKQFGTSASVEIEKLEGLLKGFNAQLKNLGGEKALAIGEVFGDISSQLSSMANSFKGVNSGASRMFETMSRISNVASQMNNTLGNMKNHMNALNNGTADFSSAMSAGSGYLGAFMSIVGMIDGIMQKSKRDQAIRDEERRLAQERYYLGEMEWQRKLSQMELERLRREQLGLSSRRDEMKAMYDDAILKENQLNDIASKIFDPNRVLKTGYVGNLHQSEYVEWTNASVEGIIAQLERDIATYADSTDKYWISKVKQWRKDLEIWRNDILLTGKTWQELGGMLERGVIPKENEALVRQYVELNKQLEEAGYNIEDLKTAMRELATGTSMEALSDQLADAFRKGEDAVYSFGQTMEEVLKNAVVSAFKNEYIVKEMDELFKMFGDMGLDGQYTQEELDQIRRMSQEATERLQQQWDALNSGLDLNFGTGISNTAVDSVKRITESQADRLVGLMNGLQIATNIQTDELRRLTITAVAFNEYGKQSLAYLNAIQTNTLRTANNTDSLSEINTNIRNLANNQVEQNRAYGIQ